MYEVKDFRQQMAEIEKQKKEARDKAMTNFKTNLTAKLSKAQARERTAREASTGSAARR